MKNIKSNRNYFVMVVLCVASVVYIGISLVSLIEFGEDRPTRCYLRYRPPGYEVRQNIFYFMDEKGWDAFSVDQFVGYQAEIDDIGRDEWNQNVDDFISWIERSYETCSSKQLEGFAYLNRTAATKITLPAVRPSEYSEEMMGDCIHYWSAEFRKNRVAYFYPNERCVELVNGYYQALYETGYYKGKGYPNQNAETD